MNINEIGQLFVVGFEGTVLSENLKEFLLDLKPAGVILFSRNIEGPFQVATLNRDLQLFAMDNWTDGLLIGIDQEGGRVRRLRSPFASCPTALNLSIAPLSVELVRSYMTVVSYEIGLAGFNTNFVPVLDVVKPTSEHATSVIGDRSFGGNPTLVARLGQVVVESVRSMGVIPCGKHFPGHGGTMVDSHFDLPIDGRDKEILRERDMLPFKTAIDQGIEMLMTAHVVYTSLDPLYPGTLSQTVVNEVLRSDFGYTGVVITDDLDMGAIANHYDPASRVELALKAGVDLLLFSKSAEDVIIARDAIVHGISSGIIPVDKVADALGRVKDLKKKYKPHLLPAIPDEVGQHFYL